MVTVNSKELFNYLKRETKKVDLLSNKELVLATFATQHLQGHYDFYVGTSLAATGTGLVVSFFSLNPALMTAVITAGAIGAVGTCYNLIKTKDLKRTLNIFTEELVKRYPNVLDAYVNISEMIQSIERDEIIEYFNRANNN